MNLPSIPELQTQIDEIVAKMSDPAINRNVVQMKRLSSDHKKKTDLLALLERTTQLEKELNDAESLLADTSNDNELRSLAEDDIARLTNEKKSLDSQVMELMVPRDERDNRDVILEIRAGAGGEEAALFAAELFRAYTRYAEFHGWKMHTINTSFSEQGGFKEVIAELTGNNVFGTMKYERGVHRVQRVPETEKQGRIHTSTITVAVLPQAEEADIEIKPEDLRIDAYRAGGAGGQHVNKTSSAIRITHIPTNTVVAVQDERSQHKNKERAMSILRSRLLEAREEKQRVATANERRQQVGTGDRSEKIRTYNFPQDRITDHRIKKSWGNIPAVMEGEWGDIFTSLRDAETELILQNTTL